MELHLQQYGALDRRAPAPGDASSSLAPWRAPLDGSAPRRAIPDRLLIHAPSSPLPGSFRGGEGRERHAAWNTFSAFAYWRVPAIAVMRCKQTTSSGPRNHGEASGRSAPVGARERGSRRAWRWVAGSLPTCCAGKCCRREQADVHVQLEVGTAVAVCTW